MHLQTEVSEVGLIDFHNQHLLVFKKKFIDFRVEGRERDISMMRDNNQLAASCMRPTGDRA